MEHKRHCLSLMAFGLASVLTLLVPSSLASTTLESVVNATLVSHPSVLGARSRARAADHAITQARSGFFPSVSLFASGGREWSKSPAVAARLIDDEDITLNREEYRIDVEQTLFAGGRVYGSVKQSQHSADSAKQLVDAERQLVAIRAVEAYLNVLRNRELVSLAEKNIEVHKSTKEKVAKRVKSGASRRVENRLATARLALAKTRLERFQGDLRSAEATYRAVTQLHPEADMELPQAPVGMLPESHDHAVAWAMQHHPSVLSNRALVLSNRAAVTVARSNFFPTITGRLSASDSNNLDGVEGPPRNQDAVASVALNYDFFNGFRDVGAVREAQELVKNASHNLETNQLSIAQEIKTDWANYEAAMEQVYEFQQYVLASQKVVEDYKTHFILGERQLFNVLDAENETFSAKLSLTNAKFDSIVNLYRIFAAMGNLTDVLFES